MALRSRPVGLCLLRHRVMVADLVGGELQRHSWSVGGPVLQLVPDPTPRGPLKGTRSQGIAPILSVGAGVQTRGMDVYDGWMFMMVGR